MVVLYASGSLVSQFCAELSSRARIRVFYVGALFVGVCLFCLTVKIVISLTKTKTMSRLAAICTVFNQP